MAARSLLASRPTLLLLRASQLSVQAGDIEQTDEHAAACKLSNAHRLVCSEDRCSSLPRLPVRHDYIFSVHGWRCNAVVDQRQYTVRKRGTFSRFIEQS